MNEERIDDKTVLDAGTINHVSSLFKYIQELNKLKQKTILDYKKYRWNLWCNDLPYDPENIKLLYKDRVDDDRVITDSEQDNILVSVHKEDFASCPIPPDIIENWLLPGWKDYRMDANHEDEKIEKEVDMDFGEGVEKTISFTENAERVKAYADWFGSREKWKDEQKRIARNRTLFDNLYSEYFALKRDGEIEEIIVANGVFCDANDPSVCHPLLTKRVKLDFDATNNIMFIRDTESVPELYTDVLKALDDVNLREINTLQDEMVKKDYHPLDRNETPGFFKVLIRQLSSDSIYSESGIPEGWKRDYRFLLYNSPSFIIRKRQDGTVRAIEKIIEAIESGAVIPKTLIDLVSGGKVDVPPDDKEYSIEEQLAMVGGESVDVLLSKEANREQLEIAQRIKNYNAVLVQGPPGTGKTHTIANLLGHFIAQGKSVLVTSHTTKALDVLKDKIVPGLQSLCVSLLDDSNKDMERSVEGITSYMSQHSSSSLKKEMETIGEKRKDIIAGLANVRKNIFMSIQKECESITYQGESLTPTDAAKFVALNQDKLDYIPGWVKADSVLPLTFDELVELYRSNETITDSDATELSYDLPGPDALLSVTEFDELCKRLSDIEDHIDVINTGDLLHVSSATENQTMQFAMHGRNFKFDYPTMEAIQALREYCSQYGEIVPWQQGVVVDGQTGGGYRNRWENLVRQIDVTKELGANLADKGLGQDIVFAEDVFVDDLLEPLKEVKQYYDTDGRLPFMFSILHRACDKALKSVRVSGKVPASSTECELVILTIELRNARTICNNFWNELLVPYGVPCFQALGPQPERAADKYTNSISRFMDWITTDYAVFSKLLKDVGFPEDDVCGISELDSDQTALTKRLTAVHDILPACCDACSDIIQLADYKN